MPLHSLSTAGQLLCQASGRADAPPLVFLPGVHGDWTPQAAARELFVPEVHLVETAYPRINHWSIVDFAKSLASLFDRLGISSAHIVGESFGSLVAWQFGILHPERIRSFTLLGGFSRAPRFRVAAAAATALDFVPTRMLESAIDCYVARKEKKGEIRATSHGAYPAARTDRGRRATANRMLLIQNLNFQPYLSEIQFPIRYLGGSRDIVVPVRREIATLVKHLPESCNFQSSILRGAPHALIASHPQQTVDRILRWVRESENANSHLAHFDNSET